MTYQIRNQRGEMKRLRRHEAVPRSERHALTADRSATVAGACGRRGGCAGDEGANYQIAELCGKIDHCGGED